jgi:hypothetical protein
MSSNRNIRNPQQLRALIQNMGRSIDEARSRRLGPDTPAQPAPAARNDTRNEIRGEHSAPANMNMARGNDGQRPGAHGSPGACGERDVRRRRAEAQGAAQARQLSDIPPTSTTRRVLIGRVVVFGRASVAILPRWPRS